MLVFSRMKGQRFIVGDYVITLVDNRGINVRIGVDAPRDVIVKREEISDRDFDEVIRQTRDDSPAPASGDEAAQGSASGESGSPSR